MDPTTRAATNRAIRNIQTELEFLHDHNLLTESQLAGIEQLLPQANSNPTATPVRSTISPPPQLANVTEHFGQASLNEKRDYYQQQQQQQQQRQQPQYHHSPPPQQQHYYQQPAASPAPPPPAYNQPPMPPPPQPAVLAHAVSLYAYHPSDAGDLALQPSDHVEVLEYMNADWAKGRNERTGMEGIFPRSYVRIEEKGMMHVSQQPPLPQRAPDGMGYGNVPLQVASEPVQGGQQPNKINENGKKFGKKLGNAAIFGAGATIGGNIVNSIF